MSDFIRGRERTIGELLQAEFAYRIPGYQRPYAWPRERALQLLDDIVASLERGRRQGRKGADYYLGNVIVSRPEASPVADIVDGQQRLITLTILLALLRDRGGALAGVAARAIADASGAPRVRPRDQDATFLLEFAQLPGATARLPDESIAGNGFGDGDEDGDAGEGDEVEDDDDEIALLAELAEIDAQPDDDADGGEAGEEEDEEDSVDEDEDDDVEGDDDELSDRAGLLAPVNDSRRAMLDNREVMRRRLDALFQAGEVSVDDLTRFLLERCHVIQVVVPDNADAHRVFIVMHTRGLDLTDTDILKSEVLGAIRDPAELAACQRIWEDAEARLGRDAFKQLFVHLRTIRLKTQARKAIFTELRDAFLPEQAPAGFIRETVAPAAERLDAVRRGSWRCSRGNPADMDEINRRLVRLSLLPHTAWTPVAMRLLEAYGDDAATLLPLVRRLDTLSYGLFLIEPLEERIRRFAAVLRAIDEGRSATQLATRELALNPVEAHQLGDMITRGSLRSSALKRIVLLRRLDAEQLDVVGPLPNYRDTNVEHVLPESPEPGSRWREWFPKPKGFVQSLGNLIVIPAKDNLRLGNEELDVKQSGSARKRGYRQIYAEHGFGLIPAILEAASWRPDLVGTRQRRFEDLLLQLWQLDRPSARTKAALKRQRRAAAAAHKQGAASAQPAAKPTGRKRRRRKRKPAPAAI